MSAQTTTTEQTSSGIGAAMGDMLRAGRALLAALLTFLLWALTVTMRAAAYILTVAPRTIAVAAPIAAAAIWGVGLLLASWRAVALASTGGGEAKIILALPILAAALAPWAAADSGRLPITLALAADGALLLVIYHHMAAILAYAVIALYILPMAQLGLTLTLIYTRRSRRRQTHPQEESHVR